jgi:hypothetical protein
MYRRFAPAILVAPLVFLPLGYGCGDSHPPVDSSLTEAKVKGTIKFRGKPAQGGGQVSFNPSNVERKVGAFTAKIADDGSYSLTTYTGLNEIKFSGPFLRESPEVALVSHYLDVKAGETTRDFSLGGGAPPDDDATSPARIAPGGALKK